MVRIGSGAEREAQNHLVRFARTELDYLAEAAAAFGVLGRKQVASAGTRVHHFAGGRDSKALGNRLLRFDTFGASHKSFSNKRAAYRNHTLAMQGLFQAFRVAGARLQPREMKLRVYAYDKCGTCRQALKFLAGRGVPFDTVPIREQPPT